MMEVSTYIESGILELYVFGTLTESEIQEVGQMAKKHPEVQDEIISIEKAVISLSHSMAPHLSASNYDRIKESLIEKHGKIVEIQPKKNVFLYLGWAAVVVLTIGLSWQYTQLTTANNRLVVTITENDALTKELTTVKLNQTQAESVLAVVRDQNNTVVALAGQAVSPESSAKVYWNKTAQTVYVDAAGLPEPPDGFVYQVWSLKLNPLTPTSIGLLDDFKSNDSRLFAVSNTTDAEAFGITLEPDGGSISPNLEQLYTLGKV